MIAKYFFKSVSFFLFSLLSLNGYSQFEGSFVKLSYRHDKVSVDPISYLIDTTSGLPVLNSFRKDQLSINSINIGIEVFKKFLYIDGNFGLSFKNKFKITDWTGNNHQAELRIAGGTYINKCFGVMLGIQGARSVTVVNKPDHYGAVSDVASVYRHVYIDRVYTDNLGGNMFGPGAHVLLAIKPTILFRFSYMYYWISRERGSFKGKASNPEFAFYYRSEGNSLLIFLKCGALTKKINKGYLSDGTVIVPSTHAETFYLNLGLGFPINKK